MSIAIGHYILKWLLARQQAEPTIAGKRLALDHRPAGQAASKQKQKLFTDRLLGAVLGRLQRRLNAL